MSNALGPSIRTAPSAVPVSRPGSRPLILGAIIFSTEECPEDFPIGALRQMIVERTLPGGTRIINKFGPSPDPVAWGGKFWAANVQTRVSQLQLYCASGQTVLLAWGVEKYNVIVTHFVPHYHHGWYTGYEIEVTVVSDANGAFTIASGVSIDQQVQGLQTMMFNQNNIVFQLDPSGAAVFQPNVLQVQQAIQDAGPLATASPTAIQNINTQLNAALGLINTYAGQLQELAPGKVPQLAATLQLASAITAIGDTANRGQQPNSQIVQGGDLFGIAAQNYGDPTLAFQLASVNGLLSPWLTSARQTTITLPPLTSGTSKPN